MPRGTYHHLDPGGSLAGVEVFSCAPGPSGWRYVSQVYAPVVPDAPVPAAPVVSGAVSSGEGTSSGEGGAAVGLGEPLGRVDVTVDAGWRQVRVVVSGGGWTVRGGMVGPDVVWLRTPTVSPGSPDVAGEEQAARAVGLTGRSPAFAVVTARLLGLGLLDRRRVRLLGVTEPACATLPVDEGWAMVDVTEHETETAPLRVERYEVADLATAERRVIHLAGDVVLEAPGLELADLESPPNQ